MTIEYLLSVYLLSGIIFLGLCVWADGKVRLKDLVVSLTPVLNTILAGAGVYIVIEEIVFTFTSHKRD